jgi:L-seryl-tRNA(Ser) seleniumtransferase
VGTTNRTKLSDYSGAIDESIGAILKVHPSNYQIVGFTKDAGPAELVDLAHRHQVPFVYDVGSGLLDDQVPWIPGPPPSWIGNEPGIRQSIRAGVDLVLFSGDKLFGGPQAGVIAGRRKMIETIAAHPLARAFRIDGPRLAGLGATAELYADGRAGEIPLWSMAARTYAELERRALRIVADAGIEAQVEESTSVFGGGSLPGSGIPSPVISIDSNADSLFLALLQNAPPILARREGGRLRLDLRAIGEDEDEVLTRALARACR